MKKSKQWFSLVSMLVILSMVLAACGGTNEPAGGAATATAPAGGDTGAANTPAAGSDTGTPTAGTDTGAANTPTTGGTGGSTGQGAIPGVLRVNWGSQPDEIDPQKMSFVGEIGTGQLVFEGLMELNENLEPVGAAAESCTASEDGLTYTCKLREGLKYSDGTALTAKNFEYAWKRLFDPRVPNKQYSFVAYDIKGAEELDATDANDTAKIEQMMGELGVKATDDKTIVFTLKQKAAYFPYVLTLWTGWPSRQDLVEAGGEEWTTEATGKYYVGNGPFILKQYNEQGFRFEANPNYRKGTPKIKEIRGSFITDSAVAFQAYKNGELDAIGLAAEDYKTVQEDAQLKQQFIQVAGSCSFYVGFNTKKPPFDNMKVRQAFAQAFDREDYVNNVLSGLGQSATSFIPPDRPGYAPDINLYPFDKAKAKATLAEAGFADGQGLPEIKLTYSASPRNKTRMEWVQNQLKQNLGLDLQLDPVEPKAYTALTKDPATTPQVFFLGWCQDYPDPQNWLTLVFHSTSTITSVGWKNDEFDTLTRQADAEPDKQKRTQMYRQAQEILVREAPAVFLYWNVGPWLIKPYFKGARETVNPQDAIVPGFFKIQELEIAP